MDSDLEKPWKLNFNIKKLKYAKPLSQEHSNVPQLEYKIL